MKVIKISEVAKVPKKGDPMFTGKVTMQPVIGDVTKGKKWVGTNIAITQVSFGRGVRNKFHIHSTEQILIVTRGKGIVTTAKEEKQVGPGDVIFIPAGEKHWHGAAPGALFSHLYVMPAESEIKQVEK
ncbi:cupin domain-containing protein [Chloroflexota bacterium]